MFFEGSEKKLEVVVDSSLKLRELDHGFWVKLVKACNAEIISELSDSSVDAYLLSESSLFVWDDRFLILTCGTTSLVNSALFFLDAFRDNIRSLIFQRKNEYESRFQKTSFGLDVKQINKEISGLAYRLGNLDTHHSQLFYSDKEFICCNDDVTTELLMYHIDPVVRTKLQCAKNITEVRDILGLHASLKDYKFDDHLFTPYGYSLNGICNGNYVTVHISPEDHNSYISFESNLNLETFGFIYTDLLERLNPSSFDTISFNQKSSGFINKKKVRPLAVVNKKLDNGYEVEFVHYANVDGINLDPVEVEVGV